MRNPGAVYRKLKEIKFRYLSEMYKKFFKKEPHNCKYNYLYKFPDGSETQCAIRLCMLHQPALDFSKGINPQILDICNCTQHSEQCNAFCPKYIKDEIKLMLEEDLKDKKIRDKIYPEISALEWVLERSVVGIPPFTWIQAWYYSLKRLIVKNIL